MQAAVVVTVNEFVASAAWFEITMFPAPAITRHVIDSRISWVEMKGESVAVVEPRMSFAFG